ncbi:MAG: hypothetical protein VKO64_07445 [Candidatus Sericytochromatia bacterium]|nr:hypothetical protein [Candidatus Sericytochromatia bacterium]
MSVARSQPVPMAGRGGLAVVAGIGAVMLASKPVSASTLPTLDFQPDWTTLSAGWLTLACDRALDDRTSIGAAASPLLGVVGLRWTRRLSGDADTASLGFSMHLGTTLPDFTGMPKTDFYGSLLAPMQDITYRTDTYAGWTTVLHPQLIASLPLGPLRLRVAVGPAALLSSLTHGTGQKLRSDLVLVVNPELALRILPGTELTLLGQGLAGVRTTL